MALCCDLPQPFPRCAQRAHKNADCSLSPRLSRQGLQHSNSVGRAGVRPVSQLATRARCCKGLAGFTSAAPAPSWGRFYGPSWGRFHDPSWGQFLLRLRAPDHFLSGNKNQTGWEDGQALGCKCCPACLFLILRPQCVRGAGRPQACSSAARFRLGVPSEGPRGVAANGRLWAPPSAWVPGTAAGWRASP